MSVDRYPIPTLQSHAFNQGPAGVLTRYFPVEAGDFFRALTGTMLHIAVETDEEYPDAIFVLHTDIGQKNEWHELSLNRKGKFFDIDIPLTLTGHFSFKLKYSLDNGATWYWDRVPYTRVLVDPADTDDVRMYTLLPNISGTIDDWIKRLDDIAAMHFNAVHLLPITAMAISESPYAAEDLFAIDESYLNKDDSRSGLEQFESFVARCQELGLKLCVDLVFNHIGITSHMIKSCPSWLSSDKTEFDGFKRAGCWHNNSWITWGDLVRINYDHPHAEVRTEIWNYVKSYCAFWGNYAHQTGGFVRFDNLHSSHEAFVSDLTVFLHSEFPQLKIVAEFFTDDDTMLKQVPRWGLNLLLANSWEYTFAPQLRDYMMYIHRMGKQLRYFTPITTHDTGSPAQEYGKDLAVIPRYCICALMSTGQTGLTQGSEHGVPEKLEFIGRRNEAMIFEHEGRFSAHIAIINKLIEQHATFHQVGNLTFIDEGHQAILAAFRDGSAIGDDSFIVIANLDTTAMQQCTLDVAEIGIVEATLQEVISAETKDIERGLLKLNMPPCGIRVYKI
jgi:hypothetical protein